jgi:sRNA-binding carbon storage regulator CsrA
MLTLTRCPHEAIRIGDIYLYVADIYPSVLGSQCDRADFVAILPDNHENLIPVQFTLREGENFCLGDVDLTLNKVTGQRIRASVRAPDGVEIFRAELLLPRDDPENPFAGLIYNIHQLALAMPRHDDTKANLTTIFAGGNRPAYIKRIEDCTKQISQAYPGFSLDTRQIIQEINDADFLGAVCHARELYEQRHGVRPDKHLQPGLPTPT